MALMRCLVVDDDPELLQSVCDYLRRFGFEAVAASTAAQMRSLLSQGGVDVVVLDVMLPDGDGLAICAALRQRPETASLPVIMLTAQGDPQSRVLGYRGGPLRRAAGEQPPDLLRHPGLERDILTGPSRLVPFPTAEPDVFVGQALLLRLPERRLLGQDALPLVPFPRPAPAHHDRR